MEIQTLNLSDFRTGNHDQRATFAETLNDNFTRHGFVKLVDHGFSDSSIDRLWSQVMWMTF